MEIEYPIIGFYGLGSMGISMAENLQRHLHTASAPALRYSNRTLSKGLQLKTMGAVAEESFVNLAKSCDIIFTMVSNDQVLTEIMDSALDSGIKLDQKIFIDTSTVHPDTSATISTRLVSANAQFIASPVFGASTVAASGKLIFAMAGPDTAIDTVAPFIQDVMARSIIRMGADVRRSSLLKITGNIAVIGFMELISECHVFAEQSGLGTDVLHQFLSNMYGPTIEGYSKRLTTGAFAPPLETPPGFAVALAVKDAKHALSIADGAGCRLPTMQTALGNMMSAQSFAGSWLDSSAMYGALRQQAGMEFWSDASRKGN